MEETVIFVLSDIQVNASPNNVEECHRIVKPGSKKKKKKRKKNSPFFDQETLEETPVEQKKIAKLR